MKRSIDENGKWTHKLTNPDKQAIRKVMVIVNEVAWIHRNDNEGEVMEVLADTLELMLPDSDTVDAKPDATADSP